MTSRITGIVGTSRKENEHRLPIHPEHLARIPATHRSRLFFEEGYGRRFGVSPADLAEYCGGLLPRLELLMSCNVVVLPKPTLEDLGELRDGVTLWGWPHCVQQPELTQVAIDKKLTLIAFESMFAQGAHIFYKNNELAGYCSVLHALRLLGIDGHYGPPRKVAVLGFGSVSRGAIYALRGRGFSDITIYTQRPAHLVRDQMYGCHHRRMRRAFMGGGMEAVRADGSSRTLVHELAQADVIVNGTLQDTDKPIHFVHEREIPRLRDGCLIVDVSADLGMGFPFARPTSFEEPIRRIGGLVYYGVDHSPTYLWNSATWAISEGLLPYLPAVMDGPESWDAVPAVDNAIEIRGGVVHNPKILSFQNREETYPHRIRR